MADALTEVQARIDSLKSRIAEREAAQQKAPDDSGIAGVLAALQAELAEAENEKAAVVAAAEKATPASPEVSPAPSAESAAAAPAAAAPAAQTTEPATAAPAAAAPAVAAPTAEQKAASPTPVKAAPPVHLSGQAVKVDENPAVHPSRLPPAARPLPAGPTHIK